MLGGGFPVEPIRIEMRALGIIGAPREDASRMDTLRELWTGAGLKAVQTTEITVRRTFADFENFWTTTLLGSSVGPTIAKMTAGEHERLKNGVRARLPADASGRITYGSRANAVKGRVPS